MAGLKELIDMESIEDQPTSSVPKNKSDYTEPYDPSMARGLAGIAVAGAGAFALRNPIGRVLQKIASIKLPKAPASRTSVKDQVDEVLEIAPTKMERGKALTVAQTKPQDEIRQIAIARSNELKKIAYNNPLSRGGKTNRIGSSLWDYIARHPIAGARKPEEWIKDFKSTGPGSFKTGNPNFKNISQAVKKDELWDSNLVQFDKDGKVVGGFLKIAAEKKIPLTKMDLLYIVEKAPVNNLKVRKLTTDTKIVDEAEDVANEAINYINKIRDKAVQMSASLPANESEKFAELVTLGNGVAKNLRRKTGRLNNHYRSAETSDYDDFDASNVFGQDVDDLKALFDKARNVGVTTGDDTLAFLDKFKRIDTDLGRRLQLMKTQRMLPKYGNYDEYRVKGGEKYFEHVVYYPKSLPMGQRLGSDFQKHYTSDIGATKSIPNQIYHMRGTIRTGGTNQNQKVMMIDEIQSDYHQKLRRVDPKRTTVVNAFGSEIEFFSANRKLEKIIKEMKDISNKGIRATPEDMQKFNKLNSDFRELRANSMNLSNISSQQAGDGIPFLPLYGKENYGSHAIKNAIKTAADEGVDWVAIAPVEQLHHAKRTKYLGDIEFYGNRFGKAGFKNYGGRQGVMKKNSEDMDVPIQGFTDPKKMATLPNEMKKLAAQYGSEVKTIPIAKSDPSKPFKVVTKVENTKKVYGLNPDTAGTQHIGAFRTLEEAEDYKSRYGGTVVKMFDGDTRLYFDAFAIKVSPEMKAKPFKAYQTGGLVVNIFA